MELNTVIRDEEKFLQGREIKKRFNISSVTVWRIGEEMKELAEYSSAVIRVSPRCTLYDMELFEKYLRNRDDIRSGRL